MSSCDLRTRLRAILEQVEKRADTTLSQDRARGSEFRDVAIDLHNAAVRAKAWIADGYDDSILMAAAVPLLMELLELLLRMGSKRASRAASSKRPSAGRATALKLFAEKKTASPRKSDKAIKGEIRRALNVHRATITRWFRDQLTQ